MVCTEELEKFLVHKNEMGLDKTYILILNTNVLMIRKYIFQELVLLSLNFFECFNGLG